MDITVDGYHGGWLSWLIVILADGYPAGAFSFQERAAGISDK
jgi:hypothetical protein